MRNLLLLLLLANVLYLVWGLVADDAEESGIVVLSESELGPPLEVTENRNTEAVVSVGAVLGSGGPTELAAVVGRSCVSIGPFREEKDADTILTQYADEGMRARLRSTEGKIFIGHLVRIPNVPDRRTGKEILSKLRAGGLEDAYMPVVGEDGLIISLGLFGDLDNAERVELQAKSLELPAEIVPSTLEGTVFFVDIGLPPAKGAGAMIEKYGEEKVLLRNAATCP